MSGATHRWLAGARALATIGLFTTSQAFSTMHCFARTRNTLAQLGLAALLVLCNGLASAQSMVSVQGRTVNLRAEPQPDSRVLWELKKGYPLKVLKQQGEWLRVRDYEGDTGWILASLTNNTPFHVVTVKALNIRQGPGLRHTTVDQVEYGEVLRTRGKRSEWLRVQAPGGAVGWVPKRSVWGW